METVKLDKRFLNSNHQSSCYIYEFDNEEYLLHFNGIGDCCFSHCLRAEVKFIEFHM